MHRTLEESMAFQRLYRYLWMLLIAVGARRLLHARDPVDFGWSARLARIAASAQPHGDFHLT